MLCGSEGISLPRPSVIPSLGKPPLTHACFPCLFPPWEHQVGTIVPWSITFGPTYWNQNPTTVITQRTDGNGDTRCYSRTSEQTNALHINHSSRRLLSYGKRLALGTIYFTVRSHQFTSLSSSLPSRLALITTCFAALTLRLMSSASTRSACLVCARRIPHWENSLCLRLPPGSGITP